MQPQRLAQHDLVRSAMERDLVRGAVTEALGQTDRENPVLARSGGPAGNVVLTAWTGLVLLVLFVAELLTLVDVRGLISWHVAIGALLVPPALMKTASTGWRFARYYLRHEPYVAAGPPPTLLRWLGPLVVTSTLGLLASGILLVLLGEETGRQTVVSVLGQRVDWVTVHQAFFAVWCVATGLHLLGRIVPALRHTLSRFGARAVPGRAGRVGALALAAVAAVVVAVLLVQADGSWQDGGRPGGPPPGAAAVLP
ncbi:hypothetical protein [Phycicoccus flavus]|uniref:Uncharacterized protein n=1 Tax=Phycicoccus flavus TaxID=2502783 RepID=A0A8T6R1M4_9MICO|nr:hypothetical protein [Phycicoccus flavus]NHA67494.1 hypothetical protein [Phycicoccus flavus]